MRRALAVTVCLAATAHASPWTVGGEAGTEVDTNVQRVETPSEDMTVPITAFVGRFGAHVDYKSQLFGGNLAFNLSDLTRLVADAEASVENVTTLAGNARWLHALGDRPAALGLGVMAIDAIPLSDPVGARTFRTLGPDALLALQSDEDRTLSLALGLRDFRYKPDPNFDWWGPVASARLELVLWQPAAKTRSLELAGTLSFENRTFYTGLALANACAPDAPPSSEQCTGPTDIQRRDRYQRASLELTWIGRQLATLAYQITVIDSNSYGQSLARHRVTLSATTQLPWELYGTLIAILQYDQYLDGLVVRPELQQQEFTSIEDENRSSLQLRVARHISSQLAVEARAAVWRNITLRTNQPSFERELLYIGLVYGK